jgi:hypothetical protein
MRGWSFASIIGIAALPLLPSRPLPTGNTKIALSEGSKSPLPAAVSLLLVLHLRKRRGISIYSAF